jgi:hypothetical protein
VVLVLLPETLERFAGRDLVEALMATGLAVVADPPRTSYRRIARLGDAVATKQARRLRRKLRAEPRAVVIFDPAQYPLARALLSLVPGCELWYEQSPAVPDGDARLGELHKRAVARAQVRFSAADREPLEAALARL